MEGPRNVGTRGVQELRDGTREYGEGEGGMEIWSERREYVETKSWYGERKNFGTRASVWVLTNNIVKALRSVGLCLSFPLDGAGNPVDLPRKRCATQSCLDNPTFCGSACAS